MPQIKPNKKYITKSHNYAVIERKCNGEAFNRAGHILIGSEKIPCCWTSDGRYFSQPSMEHPYDIICEA
jgi:hypothetical protein